MSKTSIPWQLERVVIRESPPLGYKIYCSSVPRSCGFFLYLNHLPFLQRHSLMPPVIHRSNNAVSTARSQLQFRRSEGDHGIRISKEASGIFSRELSLHTPGMTTKTLCQNSRYFRRNWNRERLEYKNHSSSYRINNIDTRGTPMCVDYLLSSYSASGSVWQPRWKNWDTRSAMYLTHKLEHLLRTGQPYLYSNLRTCIINLPTQNLNVTTQTIISHDRET
jgi:hypothetical protein